MKNKTYLILGSTGFIGSHLMEKLISKNQHVVSFSTSAIRNSKIEHVQADLRNTPVLAKLIKRKPDVIYCLAGISGQMYTDDNPKISWDVNVRAYIDFLDVVVRYSPSSRVIISSTRLEYGQPRYLPVNEDHPIQPVSLYGISKHIISDYSQYLFRKFGIPIVILRSSNPYGPHSMSKNTHYNVINYFIDQAKRDEFLTVYGKGQQRRDYLYIEDLINAFLTVANNKKAIGNVYNIGSGQGQSLVSVAKLIIKLARKGKLKFINWPPEYKKIETGDYVSDISKIKKLGWYPHISLEEGIRLSLTQNN